MINKERLEELIKQKATIWCPYYMFIEEGIQLDNKDYIDDEILYVVNGVWKYNFRNPPLKLEYLFETKEDAEFALTYQNITRTETLSLPTWEEFKIVHFIDNLGTHYELEKIRNKICLDFSNDGDYYIKDLQWEATKENYLEACELCRKLFLGENDE